MVIGLTSKMVLSLYAQNVTLLFSFVVLPWHIFKGAMQPVRHSPEEDPE